MKALMRRVILAVAAVAVPVGFLMAGAKTTMDGPMTDTNAFTGQAYQKRFNLNLDEHNMDYVSAQVVYSSGTYSQKSFNDGTASSGTLTVVTNTALSSATATAAMFVVKNTAAALANATVFLGGVNVKQGLQWNYDLTAASGTACNIAAALNTAGSVFTSTCAVNSTVGVIYSTAPTYGAAYNSYSLDSSTRVALSTSAFTGGQDNAYFCINGTCLYANRNWYPKSSAAATADSIYAAINSSFTGVAVSTDVGATAVVYTTSAIVGTAANYTVVSSTQAALRWSGNVTTTAGVGTSAMSGGSAASYTYGSPNITITSHGLPTGLKVSISSTTGNQALLYSTSTAIGTTNTLAFGSTWYVIPVDANTIALSLTSTGAVAGTSVVLASTRALTTADSWAVNVATAAGVTSYGWYASNDGANFFPVIGTSSTTILTGDAYVYPSTFSVVDFGQINYKWLQLNVSPPATSGAISIRANIHGEAR